MSTLRLQGDDNVTFYEWLLTQKKRDDPVGDLARDVAQDSCWPAEAVHAAPTLRYLEEISVSRAVLEAARRAWREYRADRDSF